MAPDPTRTQAGKPGSPSKSAGPAKSGRGSSGGGKGQKNAKERAASERRARAQEARTQAAKAERRSKVLRIGGIAAAAAVGVGIIAFAALSRHDSTPATPSASAELPHPAAAAGTAMPPWPVPADTVGLGQAAGLRALNTEGEVLHFHPHLDVFVDGKAVSVPAEIGIDATASKISELHTHDTTGVLHVEAPDKDHRYVLGQLFDEWNVRLDPMHLGGLTAGGGNTLTAYVDGKQVSGDPGQIELLPHREIAVVFGPAGQHVQVPSSYQFPAGE